MTSAMISTEQARSVLDFSRILAVTSELDPLLRQIAEAATSLLHCERASIFVHDPRTGELWTKIALQHAEIRIPATAGIAGHAFTSNQTLHVSDPYHDDRFDADPDRNGGFVTRNLLAVPMLDIELRPLGVIEAVNKRHGDFAPEDQALLRLLAEQAGVAIQRYRLQAAALEIVSLRHEMELARRVQQAILPVSGLSIAGFEVAGWTQSASITGGDIYDVWTLPDGRLALLIADASGHGMAAALLVHQARSLARAISPLLPHPHDILNHVHEQLQRDVQIGWFVTAFLALLSPDGTVEWSSAGQGSVFVRESANQPSQAIEPVTPPLGVAREWPVQRPAPLRLQHGGMLVALTDGIHENMNPAGDEFGLRRVAAILDAHGKSSPDELIRALREAAEAWRSSKEYLDDQAIVAVRRND